MASSKEMHQTSRPLTLNRPSVSTSSSTGLTSRQSHLRANSHSVTLGSSLNANHRVTRRKSMTNTATNVAAVAAAIKEAAGDRSAAVPIAVGARRNTASSRSAAARAAIVGSLPSPPASLPSHRFMVDGKGGSEIQESAIEDDPIDMSGDEPEGTFEKARVRRASDGQPLVKDGKRSNRPELKCTKCGKGYKHSSCLTKHLWEHTPEWSLTSKLLISKHQQVQLLEAASVLVAMNNSKDGTTPPDSAKDFPSEPESASPAASAADSDPHERQSSADTTPPPQLEPFHGLGSTYQTFSSKRSSSGSGFSRSYQSAPFTSLLAGSAPNGSSGFGSSGTGHFRQHSYDRRPPSSGRNATGQDDRDLAAAVELLSCSFGSNNGAASGGASSRSVMLPADAPPVPPLPAQYLDQAASVATSTGWINSFPSRQPESFTRGDTALRSGEDVKMEESGDSASAMDDDDDDDDMISRARSDEDDDGVFGRMEE